MKRVAFVDRDGTIIREPADFQIDTLEKLEFLPGVVSGLKLLVDSGFELVMVTNQDGLGSKNYPKKAFDRVQGKVLRLLEGEGVSFAKILVCPHFEKDGCSCRKPKLGLLKPYLAKNQIDLKNSVVLGDRETDVTLAKAIGVKAVRIIQRKTKTRADYSTADAGDACRWIVQSIRSSSIKRETKETSIETSVKLDGTGRSRISTGIPFFDHMLEQLARHSSIDLELKAKGDLHIDAHHTVEDTGIVIGSAIKQALGDMRGLERFAFAAPLDESKAEVVLDLSGRGHLEFEAEFKRAEIGGLPTEMIEHFFRSLAESLKCTLHISCKGKNDHHKAEAIFKASARAFKQAIQVNARTRKLIPSTKGAL